MILFFLQSSLPHSYSVSPSLTPYFSRCVVVACLWWISAWQGHGGGVFFCKVTTWWDRWVVAEVDEVSKEGLWQRWVSLFLFECLYRFTLTHLQILLPIYLSHKPNTLDSSTHLTLHSITLFKPRSSRVFGFGLRFCLQDLKMKLRQCWGFWNSKTWFKGKTTSQWF